MATVTNILTFARTQAQTDSNGLTDTNGLIFANEALVDFRRRLITAGVDSSGIQEAYRDTTVDTGTYLYPTDMFFLKTIELNYQNTNEQDYVTAQQVDVSNLSGGSSFSWLRKNANKNTPLFDDRGDWFEIFPTPIAGNNLTNAIRLFYFLDPTEYSAVSDTLSYPETLDYRVLGWRIAANYLYALGKMEEGDRFTLKYEERVKELIETLSRGSQQPITATNVQLTGFEY